MFEVTQISPRKWAVTGAAGATVDTFPSKSKAEAAAEAYKAKRGAKQTAKRARRPAASRPAGHRWAKRSSEPRKPKA